MSPEALNAIGTFSAAVAAIAALVSIVLAASEGKRARARDRFVRWCEEPAIGALNQFHDTLIEPLEKSLQRDPDQDTYQWQAQQVQSAKRALLRSLSQAALSLGDGALEGRVVLACNRLEDGILEALQAYAVGNRETLDVDEEVRLWSTRVAEVVARGDPTWDR